MTDFGDELESDVLGQSASPQILLSHSELAVLSVFRRYLMTPGKMLCLSTADVETFRAPLGLMTDKGLLVAESFRGGYSLTESGFSAMQDIG